MTGCYTFAPARFHASRLVKPSSCGEYELSDAIDLLIQSSRTIDAIRRWLTARHLGYPEDRDRRKRLEKQTEREERGELETAIRQV